MKRRGITAGEFTRQLESDPDWVRERDKREVAHRAREAKLARAERPLVDDLNAAGWPVESVWEFVNTTESYSSALPTLSKHLDRPYPDAIRDGIARALAVPEARKYCEQLRRSYLAEDDGRAKQGLAAALSVAADESVIGELVDLALDPANGESRLLFLPTIANSRSPIATRAVAALRLDPAFAKQFKAWDKGTAEW